MTAQEYSAVLDSLDVEHNAAYQPGYLVPQSSWCNRLCSDATAKLGCPIPFRPANAQYDWLRGGGASGEWVEVTNLLEATAHAALGQPTVAAWRNNLGLHGHIALVRPNGHVCAAGAHCFNDAPLTMSFGPVVPRFFSYAAPTKEA